MGTDYTAETYIGTGISGSLREHFFRKTTETVIKCAHPEAEDKRYCPECGLPPQKRTEEAVTWVLRNEFEDYDIDLDRDIDNIDIEGLGLHRLGSYGDDTWVLGLCVGRTSSNRRGGEHATSEIDCLATVINAFTKLKINVSPQIYTHLNIC